MMYCNGCTQTRMNKLKKKNCMHQKHYSIQFTIQSPSIHIHRIHYVFFQLSTNSLASFLHCSGPTEVYMHNRSKINKPFFEIKSNLSIVAFYSVIASLFSFNCSFRSVWLYLYIHVCVSFNSIEMCCYGEIDVTLKYLVAYFK